MNTLRKPLHHSRSRGGMVEEEKYRKLYVRTLQSYRAAFGEPPVDIWGRAKRHEDVELKMREPTGIIAQDTRFDESIVQLLA